MKTESSRRKVPLHPVLEGIRLLRYREALLSAGSGDEGNLWPDLKSDVEGQIAAAWSKWFGRYLRTTAKIESRTKVFHSFRHSFKDMARKRWNT